MSVHTEIAEAAAGCELAHKHLLDDQLWDRLVGRIVKDEDLTHSLAERIMDQALGFLILCAREPQTSYSPSPLVDIGWHTFILYTRAYADFCEKLAGRFLHHEPSDVPGVEYGGNGIARTVAALKRHAITVDEPLWANTGHQDCGCGGGGCGSSCGGCQSPRPRPRPE